MRVIQTIAKCLAIASAMALSTFYSAYANVFSVNGKDPRERIDRSSRNARRLLPIGTVTTDNPLQIMNKQTGIIETGPATATIFMISPCYAMTNRHAIYGDTKIVDDSKSHSVTVRLGSDGGSGFAYVVEAKVVKRGKVSENIGHDFAILRLASCVGAYVGWMDIVPVKNPISLVGKTVSMAGYPGDTDYAKLTVQYRCTIKDIDMTLDLLQHDCANTPGASGSPIFTMVDGVPFVIAINSGHINSTNEILEEYSSKKANVAVHTRFLVDYPEIMQAVKKDIDNFRLTKPSLLQGDRGR